MLTLSSTRVSLSYWKECILHHDSASKFTLEKILCYYTKRQERRKKELKSFLSRGSQREMNDFSQSRPHDQDVPEASFVGDKTK